MVDVAEFTTLDRFIGVNNVDDQTRLYTTWVNHKILFSLLQGNNIDIDNTYAISSRPGSTPVATGSDIHSLWSDNETCLFVDTTTLKSIDEIYTVNSLRENLRLGARMSYAPWNDRIYYTNRYQIGYVKGGVSYELTDPGREFKMPLPAGQLIEYYKGRLYVAKGNIVYISDPLSDYFDIRTGYVTFANDITLLRAVDEGMYVGDDKIYWIRGEAPEEFDRKEVYDHQAILYTDLRIDGQNVGEGLKGKVAMWTGMNGICLGDGTGKVMNLTDSRYTYDGTGRGAAFVRDKNNVRHYINSLF